MGTQELRDKRQGMYEEAKGVIEGAAQEKRTLRSDEEERVNKIYADMDQLTRNIELRERLEKEERRLTEGTGRVTEPTQTLEARAARERGEQAIRIQRQSEDSLRAIQAWLLAGSDEPLTDEHRAAAQRAHVDLGNKNLRIVLPQRALRSMDARAIQAWEERDLSVGTPGDGGYTVPNEAMRALEIAMLQFGGMRQVATVIRTNTGADLPLPTSNDTSNEGQIIGENSSVGGSVDVAFGQLVLEAYKYSSKPVLVSVELLQDSIVNLADFLGRMLGERIGRITNRHFTVGTGISQPNGIVPAATASGVNSSSSTEIVYDELVALEHSVDPAYRGGAKFMFHDTTLAILQKLVDGDGRLIWTPNAQVGAPDRLLGYQYQINQNMAAMTNDAKSIVFGALDKYIIRDVRDVTLLRLDERYADTHQVAFLAFSRHDGDLLDAGTHPVKYFQNKS